MLALAACGGGGTSPMPMPTPAVTISDPLSFVAELPDATTLWSYEREDFGGYQRVMSFRTDATHATLIWHYVPFGSFNATNGDGGEQYALDSTGAVYITATQDGGKPGITQFGTDWWAFDKYVPDCAQGWRSSPDGLGRACHQVITFPGSPSPLTADTIVSEHYALPGQNGPMERAFYAQGWGRVAWMSFNQIGCAPVDPARTPAISAFDTGPGPAKCDERMNTNIVKPLMALDGKSFGWPPK